jgi:hypothetical protein
LYSFCNSLLVFHFPIASNFYNHLTSYSIFFDEAGFVLCICKSVNVFFNCFLFPEERLI